MSSKCKRVEKAALPASREPAMFGFFYFVGFVGDGNSLFAFGLIQNQQKIKALKILLKMNAAHVRKKNSY